MKERAREKLAHPIHCIEGDSLTLYATDGQGYRRKLLTDTLNEPFVTDEVVSFDVEKGDFGAVKGIGGAFLQMKEDIEYPDAKQRKSFWQWLFKGGR